MINKYKLKEILNDLGINPNSYSLDEECSDETLCLKEGYGSWSIYYSEHGLRTKEEFFENEEKACHAFLIRIKKMIGI